MVYKKGHKHSVEVLIKMRNAKLRKKFTEEHKQKLREVKLKNPTNYWLGKKRPEMSGKNHPLYGKPRTEEQKLKQSLKMKGKTSWNKGVPISDEQKNILIKCHKGTPLSEEHKQKIRNNAKYNPNFGMKGKHQKKEAIEKYKEKRKTWTTPFKDTTIEIKIQDYLKDLNIDFIPHQYINIKHGYQCDIFVPKYNLIIECDGDYWHGNPFKYPNPSNLQKEQIKEDYIRTRELLDSGYKLIRLWESTINDLNILGFETLINTKINEECIINGI